MSTKFILLILTLFLAFSYGCSDDSLELSKVDSQAAWLKLKGSYNAVNLDGLIALMEGETDPAFIALTIESEYKQAVDVVNCIDKLDGIASEIYKLLSEDYTCREALDHTSDHLRDNFSGVEESDSDACSGFLSTVLDTRKGNCLGLSLLYLSIAKRLGLPVQLMLIPGHVYVRCEDRISDRFIEATDDFNEVTENKIKSYYKNIPDTPYPLLLDDKELIAILLINRSQARSNDLICPEAHPVTPLALSYDLQTNKVGHFIIPDPADDVVYQSMLNDLDHAIVLFPSCPMVYYTRALVYLTNKSYEQATLDFNNTLSLDSQHADALMFFGLINMLKGDLIKARDYIDESLESDPGNINSILLDGKLAIFDNDLERAAESYSRGIALHPDIYLFYLYRGWVFTNLEDDDKAINDFTETIRLDPSCAIAYAYRGFVYYKVERHDLAKTDIQEALKHDPDTYQPWQKEILDKLLLFLEE